MRTNMKIITNVEQVKRFKESSRIFPDNIPPELSSRPQWVGWIGKPQSGSIKLNKIPINPMSGKAASSTDPKTWGTFEQAVAWYQSQVKRPGFIGGIGFVFSENDPYSGIDFDHCRDPETGVLRDWSKTILQSLDSYTEVSPSLEGVKVFCKAKKLKSIKKDNIEVYFTARFFTVTGRWVGDYSGNIMDRSKELLELVESLGGGKKSSVKDESRSGDRWYEEAVQGVGESQRHDSALRLACRWKVKGLSDPEIKSMLISWNEKNHPPKPSLSDPNGKELMDVLSYAKEKHGQDEQKQEQSEAMSQAKKLFPRGPFPWEVLPSSIGDSLKQLARSCASSPTSLPGAAVSIFASVIGSTISVSPKRSWTEPLIFWCSDIRPSGSGKTPAARSLCRVLYEAQTAADEEAELQMEEWLALPKKDKGKAPARPRGYFITDLTIEGLRTDHSGHGGSVCVLDELSAFLSSQNQYKAKGSDRESWLALWDGKSARIVRVGKSLTLSGSRISIFGGVQPGVWRLAFSGESGEIYLVDGTIYRFLPTFEGEGFFPLTAEAWSDENRETWESLLRSAMRWSDKQQEVKE